MSSSDGPTAEDRQFLEAQGMVEIEPGRRVGAPELHLPGGGDSLATLSVFVAVKPTSAEAFTALAPQVLEDALNRAADQYPNMLAPDLMAVSLRKLGIKCKAIEVNPATAGPEGPDTRSYQGFLGALIEFPGARRTWLEP